MLLFLKRFLVQISMVSLKVMLAKNESISKLPMKLLESCLTISLAKLNKSLTVYLLVVNSSKYFASLNVGVCKEDKIGLKGGQSSTHFLCTLQEPYIIPVLVPTGWFQMSLCFFGHAVRVNKLLVNFINVFFLTGNEIQGTVIFYSSFLKFTLIT